MERLEALGLRAFSIMLTYCTLPTLADAIAAASEEPGMDRASLVGLLGPEAEIQARLWKTPDEVRATFFLAF